MQEEERLMKSEKQKNVKGVRIRTINGVMIFVSCVLYILVIYATLQVSLRYDELITATNDYIDCEKNAALVREGSDYLTNEVRMYVVTLDLRHVDAYMREVNETKGREKALDELEKFSFSQKVSEYLEAALSKSNELVHTELYAMKLASAADGDDQKELPGEVNDIQLTAEDQGLTPEEMLDKARDMVFDDTYEEAKAAIMDDIGHSLDDIVAETGQRQSGSVDALKSMIAQQRGYISVLFVLNIVVFVMNIVLIMRPLKLYINSIKEGKLMQITGSYEFQYLALTYNDIFEINTANQELLRYRAEHDPLTGIANRGSFDRLQELLKASSDPVALLLIDVDEFKKINDGFGHDTGDLVLKKVASLLQEQFRANDCPARIGGDEFAVIMTDIKPILKDVIINKLISITAELKNPRDGLPEVTLSVGIAFSPSGMADELYKKSDKALYYVKEHGRNGYKFYDEL